MRLIVLMAGDSGAFAEAGHAYPKNLVEVAGLPLVEHVVGNLRDVIDVAERAVFLLSGDEDRRHHTGDVIRLLAPGAEVIALQQPAQGAACTALHAIEHIDRDEPLLVANGDQVVDADVLEIVRGFEASDLDGGVVTFEAVHPRWSYVRCDATGMVVEAAEKRPISRLATAGMYWFRRGGDFVDGVMSMIRKDASVDGRFYVCPVYNELVLRQLPVGTHHIDRAQYFSMASPKGVETFERHLNRAVPA
jgi:dTDP-glucose pyrophosphorylase